MVVDAEQARGKRGVLSWGLLFWLGFYRDAGINL